MYTHAYLLQYRGFLCHLVLGFRGFEYFFHSLLGAVMGALSDLVAVLIDLNIGAFHLEFLHTLEASLMDDWEVLIE